LPQSVGVVDPQYIPAIGQKSLGDILREGDPRVSLNGDVVVVVDPTEVVESAMRGKRSGVGRNAFHHAAIAATA
jgi:hypothetical protein